MTPILYEEREKEFTSNGIGRLADALICKVTEERNGAYELEMQYLISGVHFSEIKISRIIYAKPNDTSKEQAFRIYKISKPINGVVTVYAEHISYQLNHIPVPAFSAGSVGEAFSHFEQEAAVDNPFEFWSDVTTNGEMKVEVPSSIRSVLGGAEGSVLDVYGGEYEFDMYTVKLHEQRGEDTGVSLRYGKNISDLKQEESIENAITGIYPYWRDTNGNMVTLPERTLNVDAENNYPYPRVIALDMSSEFQDQPSEADLRRAGKAYIKNNNIGIPKISLTVSFEQLWQTEEYKGIAPVQRVKICDKVDVIFEDLGVNAKAKVTKTVYDVLAEKYNSIELGDSKTNLATTIAQQADALEKRPTESAIAQFINSATQLITGNKGGYIVFRLNDDKKPYEMLIMDSEDINTAKNVWRWNLSGFGFSSNGYNGPYGTAITIDGKIVADFITAGTMLADRIKGGTLELGGEGNGNGVAKVRDSAGNEIVRLDKDGVYAKGKYVCASDIYGRSIEISEGAFNVLTQDGSVAGRLFAASDSCVRIDGGDNVFIRLLGDDGYVCIDADYFQVDGAIGKTGRAEFSDGTYLDFHCGILSGGYTKEGAF